MDPEQELEKARRAIASGSDPDKVRALYKERTGQDFPVEEAQARPEIQSPEADALVRLNAQGGNGLTDFLRMAAQGATFGFADELAGLGAGMVPGGQTREEATAASRQRVEDLRTLAPGASTMAEIAGGVGVPVTAAGTAARSGGGLLSAIGRAGGAGAIQGAAYGIGDAEGSLMDRLPNAAIPTVVGGAAGAAVGVAPSLVNAVVRRSAGRANRLLGELAEQTGLTDDINKVRTDYNRAVRAARAEHFRPLDALGAVEDPRLSRWFKARGLSDKPRSLGDLQAVISRTAKRDPVAADDLRSIVEDVFPGFKDANRAYAQAIRPQEAVRRGAKEMNRPAADIVESQNSLFGPNLEREAFDAYRQGQMYRTAHNLLQRGDKGAVSKLRQMERTGQLKTLFDDPANYDEFVRVLNLDESAAEVAQQLRQIAPWLAVGAGLGAGASAVGGLLR